MPLLKRKTFDTYQLWINYGYGSGWEHEHTEYDKSSIRARRREYWENCPQYRTKIVCRRELKKTVAL